MTTLRRKPTETIAHRWDGTDQALRAIQEFVGEHNWRWSSARAEGPYAVGLEVLAGPGGESGWVHVPIGSWVAGDPAWDGDFWPLSAERVAEHFDVIPAPRPAKGIEASVRFRAPVGWISHLKVSIDPTPIRSMDEVWVAVEHAIDEAYDSFDFDWSFVDDSAKDIAWIWSQVEAIRDLG